VTDAWAELQSRIVSCERCPRLRDHCAAVAATKRAAFRDWDYWGRPLPNLGEPSARLLLVGLAPAAHGGNRTGRLFTGDRSADFLLRAMYESGFANQPTSVHRDDGLRLIDAAVTGVAHCAPPANKPTPAEVDNCFGFLEETVALMPNLKGLVALGRIAFDGCLRLYRSRGWLPAGARPQFAHGALHRFPNAPVLLCTFHPSQQNTFTGRLTPAMMRSAFEAARRELNRPARRPTTAVGEPLHSSAAQRGGRKHISNEERQRPPDRQFQRQVPRRSRPV
jgi:uracil-DNA glycosylase family 4